MNRIVAMSLLIALALVAIVPAPAAANHHSCTGSGGWLWLGPANGSNCVGTWSQIDPTFVCTVGVGHTAVGPLTVSGGRGAGCPVGVVLALP